MSKPVSSPIFGSCSALRSWNRSCRYLNHTCFFHLWWQLFFYLDQRISHSISFKIFKWLPWLSCANLSHHSFFDGTQSLHTALLFFPFFCFSNFDLIRCCKLFVYLSILKHLRFVAILQLFENNRLHYVIKQTIRFLTQTIL